MADEKMTPESDPADFKVDVVNDYLKDADQDERARVLKAEAEGEGRKGILGGPFGTGQVDPPDKVDEGEEKPETQPTGQGTQHQKGAPRSLTKAADEAAERGYIGTPAEGKPDYSQRNPDVMGREAD